MTGLSVAAGNWQVRLSFTAPDDGGSPITGYQYQMRTGNGAWSSGWINLPGNATATTRTITGLNNGTTYRFRVRAVNAEGFGAASVDSQPVSLKRTAPATITTMTATPGSGRVTLKWTRPLSGGSNITRYELRQRTGSGKWGKWQNIGTKTSRNITKLKNGTTYGFQIRSVSAAGTSAVSKEIKATPGKAPAAVKNLKATAGDRRVTLSWKAPNRGTSKILRYEYRQRVGNGTFGAWKTLSGKGTTRSVTGLTNGTSYRFQIRAVNATGSAAVSNTVTVTPKK